MTMRTRITLPVALSLSMICAAYAESATQTPPSTSSSSPSAMAPQRPRPGGPPAEAVDPGATDPNAPPISPGELTRLFDAYAVLQAQNFLKLDDDQYGEFVVRLKALQDLRRKHQGERAKIINELRKLTAPDSTATEASIRAAFETLQREDVEAQGAMAKAYENLDSVLDVRQQARFRVFEEQIERQKLNLLSRVRRRATQTPK